jgi:serine/threonine protein kinase
VADVLAGGAKYLVHQRLGEGGMGVVHLGRMVTPAGTRKIAVKRLSARHASPEAAERMIDEARLVFQLQHANICQVIDLATNDEGTFIVMEFVDGCDLKALIGRRRTDGKPLEVAAALFIAREVADGLDYAHRRKDERGAALWLVHGDVTPQNILLSREGEVKLADFGIARALGHAPGNELTAGTPGFMAPESFAGRPDQRADTYSLGVCLYSALSGQSPQSRGLDVHALLERRRDVPPELALVLERALAARPQDRYGSIRDFKRALARMLAQRYPEFDRESFAAIVRQVSHQASALDPEESSSLVSLTGTATFLSPAGASLRSSSIEGGGGSIASPHGTERAKGKRPTRRWRAFGWAIAAGIVALATISLRGLLTPSTPRVAEPPVARAAPPPLAPPVALPSPPILTAAPPPPAIPPPRAKTEPARGSRHAHVEGKRPPAPTPASAAVELGRLTVNAEPWGAVFVDGRRFADQTPVYNAPIPAGTHTVSIFSPVLKRFSPQRKLVVEPRKSYDVGFDWR